MKHVLLLLLFPIFLQSQSLDWQVTDISFNQGDTVDASFAAYGFTTLSCYHFALKFDTAELAFVAVQPLGILQALGLDDFSWHGKPGYPSIVPGEIRHAWSYPYGATLSDGAIPFKIRFTAKQSGTLSEALQLWAEHPIVKPRAYKFPLVPIPLMLAFVSAGELSATVDLEASVQIYPNPTTGWLWIESPTPVEVKIFDFSGRMTHCDTVTASGFSGLTDGVNLVWVTDGKEIILKTVIKN